MPRHGWTGLCLVATLVLAGPFATASPPEPSPNLETTLALQKAMVMARSYLRMDDPKKAVDVLEQHLSRVNGHTVYLELLRDAYRAYIKDLCLKSQPDVAQRYLQRLTILDPSAANDPTLRTGDAPKFVPPVPRQEKQDLPNYEETHGKTSKAPKVDAVAATTKAPIVRAIREMPGDDPFDLANERVALNRIAADPARLNGLLSRGHEEFDRRRYAEARQFYEQAVQIDRQSVDQIRDRLGYCLLDGVVDQLNRPGGLPLADMRKQVVGAMTMAPRLQKEGDWLIKEIDQRGRNVTTGLTPDAVTDPSLNMQHFGKNPQGWMVTETTNFRIFHNQNRDLVESVALIAERTRLAMSRKWFGQDGELWTPKCEIVLHASASDYSRLTSVPSSSPGHSRIETDPVSYRVIGRRIDLHTDTMGMLEAVLPHETTHVVLAGNFGQHQVPRWADEGVAVLTEPLDKIEQHRRNLTKGQREGLVIPVRDLMNLQNYPQPKQITTFYAQSVVLVEFLTQQRGPQVFTAFLREGLKDGYEPALRKHYGWTFQELQTQWEQTILAPGQRVATGR